MTRRLLRFNSWLWCLRSFLFLPKLYFPTKCNQTCIFQVVLGLAHCSRKTRNSSTLIMKLCFTYSRRKRNCGCQEFEKAIYSINIWQKLYSFARLPFDSALAYLAVCSLLRLVSSSSTFCRYRLTSSWRLSIDCSSCSSAVQRPWTRADSSCAAWTWQEEKKRYQSQTVHIDPVAALVVCQREEKKERERERERERETDRQTEI